MSEHMPDVVGLCPVHLHEFYAPHGGICPQCQQAMVEYVPVDRMRDSSIARARGLAQAIAECRDDARLDGVREGAAETAALLER